MAPHPKVLLKCTTCPAHEPAVRPCHGSNFSWQHNRHMQKSQRAKPEFFLRDDDGQRHNLKIVKNETMTQRHLNKWRTIWLRKMMGPRPPRPERIVEEVSEEEALAQQQADEKHAENVEFRWERNFHLIRDDLNLLMIAPGDPNWDIKTVTVFDTEGSTHSFHYGGTAVEPERVEKWRTHLLGKLICPFRVIYGKRQEKWALYEEPLRHVLEQYAAAHDHDLTLHQHLNNIRPMLVQRVPEADLRLELGPNLPDFILTLVSQSETLRLALDRLTWRNKAARQPAKAAKQWAVAMAESYIHMLPEDTDLNLATHLQLMWHTYCHMVPRMNLRQYRTYVLKHKSLGPQLQRFAKPENTQYRYGDLARAEGYTSGDDEL